MSLYERFSDTKEEGFREEFIKPLLVKMGFIGITNKHGPQEMGKDYVFSELDRFGVMRNMAVQAKHEEIINQGRKVDDLLSQVRQAFNSSYFLPTSPREERFISAVYVFNTGKITDNAVQQIRGGLPREWQVSTFFYDGHQLETLGSVVTRQQSQSIAPRLQAILAQLSVNRFITERNQETVLEWKESRPVVWDGRPYMLSALESYLTLPLLHDSQLRDDILRYWQVAQHSMSIMRRYTVGGVFGSENADATNRESLDRLNQQMTHFSDIIDAKINEVLQTLPAVVL